MKKTFWGFAAIPALALLATSCAQETVETKSGDIFLTYGVATGKQTVTRAAEVDLTTLEGSGFTAKAYYNSGASDNSPFQDFAVSYSGGAWSYVNHPVYHPTDGLTHYAVVPAATFTAADGDNASFDVTVGAAQVDLIAAAATTTNATQATATANMLFNHLLSQINFEVTGKLDDDIAITISAITLSGVNSESTYTLNNDNTGSWTLPTTPAGYTYTFGAADATDGGYEGANGGLMLLPQEFDAASTAKFSFNYTLTDTNTNAVIGTATGKEVLFNTAAFASKTWAPGSKYLYTINFTTPHTIEYTVVVAPWVDGAGNSVSI